VYVFANKCDENFFVSRAPLCNVVYCNGVQTLVNSGG